MTWRPSSISLFMILLAAQPVFADAQLDDAAVRVLRAKCFACHGAETQMADLRLNSREGMMRGGESGKPVALAGKSAQSLIIQRVTSADDSYRMPFARPKLSLAEIDTLTKWIDSGANWPETKVEEHWSFVAPEKPEVPEVSRDYDVRNPIDHFIIDAALERGLLPNEDADKYTLVRRAFLEVIGLPPTPEEVEAFVRDRRPGAYSRLLDRLFASPHYGERMALPWLDIARYADTNGYEKDRPRSMWPYRDWVINAYNANLPFDEFVRDQIAGDLLPNATDEQLIATGFHRNTMFNEEGGIDAAEDRFKRTVDRTNATSTAFLGLTMSCAQCHSHKSDPISRSEYYEFFAFFNDTDEVMLPVWNEETLEEKQRNEKIVDGLANWITWLGERDDESMAAFEEWRSGYADDVHDWSIVEPTWLYSEKGATLELLEDGSILATGDVPNDDVYTIDLALSEQALTGLRLEVLPDASLPGNGPGRGTILSEGGFLLSEIDVVLVRDNEEIPVEIGSATQSHAPDKKTAQYALDGKSDTGWSIDGQTGQENRAVFVFAETMQSSAGDVLRVTLSQDYIHQQTIGRFRLSLTSDPAPTVLALPGAIEDAIAKVDSGVPTDDAETLKKYYFTEIAPELEKWQEKRGTFEEKIPEPATTLALAPRMPMRETRVYHRGEFDKPRSRVSANTPEILPPLGVETKPDRLDLAAWITSRENPLTARVVMNRLWQQVFGQGIVATPDDFGIEGARPTHPELLDWLAITFMESGWDMKAMHRLLLESATFRQASADSEGEWTRDSDNTWLARGPRVRLDAEHIRDLTLRVSGLFTPTIGGPSVYPPQPPGVAALAYGNAAWPTSEGPDRYRRGIYTYLKRTAPYPTFTTFDQPMKEEACARRDSSNTPLQALTLLNDQAFMEAAHALAERTYEERGSVSAKIDFLFMNVLNRDATKEEMTLITNDYDALVADFSANEAKALTILGVEESEDAAKRAAWVVLSRVVLNLDEAIVRG